MDAATITTATFTVTGPDATPVAGSVSYDAINNIAIFAPTDPLPVSTIFTGTITTGASSAAGVALNSDFVWTFTTGASSDTTNPTVISTSPANLAVGVATNHKITVTFSDGMDSTTITGSTFTLTGPGTTAVTGTVNYSQIGATATFTPTNALATGVVFTATITTGVKDLAGNPIASLFSWSFTAGTGPDSTAPTVISTNPANGASSVSTNASVNATFSAAIDPSTLTPATFTLTGPGATSVPGKVSYNATNRIATFTPASGLATDSTFTATVTTGVTDLNGNALGVDVSWSFTTGSTAGLSPVDLGAASGFAALASSTITNTGTSAINGDVGLTPGSSVTGLSPSDVNGTIEIDTAPAVAARAALQTAFTVAAGLTGAITVAENLAGLTLTPGLYTSGATSFEITGGDLTLDAQGDANAIWIFQMPSSTLTLTTPICSVILANGAQATNVFWVVGSSATIGVGCTLEGNVLASASITLATGATMNGKALGGANAGAVTMNGNSVSAFPGGACNQ